MSERVPKPSDPERQYEEQYEKYEKQDEKQEKEHEKEEKSWEEKWRRDPIGTASWALILIWAGVVLMMNNLGLLARFRPLENWNLIFLGASGILFLQVLVRLAVPEYRRPIVGTLILAAVFLAIGLGDLIQAEILWPSVLILLGLAILLHGLFRRR